MHRMSADDRRMDRLDEPGDVPRIEDSSAIALNEVSDRPQVKGTLGVGEARQHLLDNLLRAHRTTSDPDAMMAASAEAVGRHLAVDRVGFFEMRDDDTLGFTVCWTGGNLDPLVGTMPASWIGTRYLAEVRAGQTLGVSDYTREPLTADARFDEIGTRALIGAPIIRNGRWHAGLYVNHASVREWTADDVALVRAVADQTWDAVERARAEQALRESEARFRTVWDATSDAIALSSPDGIVLAANPAYLALYGYDEAEVVGHSFAVIFPPEQRAWAEEEHRAVFADPNAPGTYEARVRRKDGTERAVEARADFVMEGDRRKALVSSVRDVSDRHAAEAALRESEERLRQALDAAEMGVFLWDPDTDRTDADLRLLKMLGLDADDVFSLASALDRNIFPDDRVRYAAAVEAMLDPAGPGRLGEEVRWIGSDSGERWLAFTGQAFFEGHGVERRAVCAIGGVLDVTDRRRAEQALRNSEERFRTLIQRSADAIQLVGTDGTILFSSDSVETVLGYRPDKIAGHNVASYVHPDDLPEILDWINEIAVTPGGVGTRQYRVQHRDGSWIWVETTIANHLDTAHIHALVGNFRDVSLRRRIEAEREAFVDAAAHDLRSPLTFLKGQAQLLLRRVRRGQVDAPGLEAGLAAIDVAAARMVAQINEMMDAAHLRAERALTLNVSPTDLVALVEDLAEETRRSTERHVVRVVADVPELVGDWDEARLVRVLANLFSNAVRYNPEGGEILVRAAREVDESGTWAVLEVSDQGMGIPEADLPYLFERFRRGGNVAGRIAGTGIGLAGAKQIIEQHGGQIMVESREGEGSTFTVRLPIATNG